MVMLSIILVSSLLCVKGCLMPERPPRFTPNMTREQWNNFRQQQRSQIRRGIGCGRRTVYRHNDFVCNIRVKKVLQRTGICVRIPNLDGNVCLWKHRTGNGTLHSKIGVDPACGTNTGFRPPTAHGLPLVGRRRVSIVTDFRRMRGRSCRFKEVKYKDIGGKCVELFSSYGCRSTNKKILDMKNIDCIACKIYPGVCR